MPRLDLTEWIIWFLVAASQLSLAILLMVNGLWRRWRSVFCFLTFNSITTFSLMAIALFIPANRGQAFYYFWITWWTAAVAEGIEVWIIAQIIVRAIGFTPSIRTRIYSGIIALSTIMGFVTGWMAFSSNMPGYSRIVFIVSRSDQAICIAWLVTFFVGVLLADLIGTEWANGVRGVAIGFALQVLGESLGSILIEMGVSAPSRSIFRGLIYVCSLCIWGYTLYKSPVPQKPLSVPDRETLNFFMNSYRRVIERERCQK